MPIRFEGFIGGRHAAVFVSPLAMPPRGGMGEVWLATRSDSRYLGQCAIKFLSSESTRDQQAERFVREGQRLGRLTHPNIARLLDAGSTEGGRSCPAPEYWERKLPGNPIVSTLALQSSH